MKRYLIFIFLIGNSFIIDDTLREFPNIRSEALGGTGMIFGEEYGSFYSAPTSLQKENINIFFKYNNIFIAPRDFAFNGSLFAKTKVGNFCLGYYFLIFYNSIPFSYTLDILKFSLGASLVYNNESVFGTRKKYFLTNASIMYRLYIGNFSISLNNFLLKVIEDSENILSREKLPINLKVGYGKEFHLNYIFNKVQLALEFENILMDNYIDDSEKDYNLYDKIHLGIEVTKNIGEFSLALRSGIKNLFPTFGIGLEFFDFIRLEYTLRNKDPNDFLFDDSDELEHMFSFEIGMNNLTFENLKKHKK